MDSNALPSSPAEPLWYRRAKLHNEYVTVLTDQLLAESEMAKLEYAPEGTEEEESSFACLYADLMEQMRSLVDRERELVELLAKQDQSERPIQNADETPKP